MAKNYNFSRSMTDKFSIKGALSEDGTVIDYINGDKEQMQIDVASCFAMFKGEEITLTISTKVDQDLSDSVEGDEE